MLCRFALALLIFIGLRATIAAAPPVAQNDSDEPAATGDTYAGIVHSDGPAAWWRFDDERGVAEVGDERLAPQAIVGPAKLQQAGPPRVEPGAQLTQSLIHSLLLQVQAAVPLVLALLLHSRRREQQPPVSLPAVARR